MATGIEVAGIVLGVLPLFISALEHYNDSLDPIKAFWDFDTQLPAQIRKLRNQHVHYEQTLRLLLSPIAEPDQVAAMISTPNGRLWRDGGEMQRRLEERLEESYDAYHETIGRMEEIMKKLAKDLKIDDSERANRTNLQSLLKRSPRKDNKFEFGRRVKFGMSKRKFHALLGDFDDCNKELERFTDKSERLEPYRAHSKPVFSPPLAQIRSYARSLYDVLCVGMSCQSPHRTRLQLENRMFTSSGMRYHMRKRADDRPSSAPCFRLSMFATGSPCLPDRVLRSWKDAYVQIQDFNPDIPSSGWQTPPAQRGSDAPQVPGLKISGNSSFTPIGGLKPPVPAELTQLAARRKTVGWDSDSDAQSMVVTVTSGSSISETEHLQDVIDICTAMKQEMWTLPCLGFCLQPHDGRLRGVYSVAGSDVSRNETLMITLEEILDRREKGNHSRGLSRKERMTLAVTLAASYLQLQATPWLPDSWGRADIAFESTTTAQAPAHIDVAKPYILQNVSPSAAGRDDPGPDKLPECTHSPEMPNSTGSATPHLPGNFSLLALAVLLMELYTGVPFEQQQKKSRSSKAENPGHVSALEAGDEAVSRLLKLSQVSQWVNNIQDDLSEAYLRAIRHCIRSYFDKTSGHEEATFQQAVLEQVLLPLQDELQTFLGSGRQG